MSDIVPCKSCGGSGEHLVGHAQPKMRDCAHCKGTGRGPCRLNCYLCGEDKHPWSNSHHDSCRIWHTHAEGDCNCHLAGREPAFKIRTMKDEGPCACSTYPTKQVCVYHANQQRIEQERQSPQRRGDAYQFGHDRPEFLPPVRESDLVVCRACGGHGTKGRDTWGKPTGTCNSCGGTGSLRPEDDIAGEAWARCPMGCRAPRVFKRLYACGTTAMGEPLTGMIINPGPTCDGPALHFKHDRITVGRRLGNG